MNVTAIKSIAIRTASRTGLVLKEHTPEILMGVGIVGSVTGTVLACKATLKLNDILDEHEVVNSQIDGVHEGRIQIKEGAEYSEQDYRKDKLMLKAQTAGKIIRLYAPAASVAILSLGCMLGAHGILRKRNVALLGLYKASEKAFNEYRARVKEELGEDKEKDFYLGLKDEKISEAVTDDQGKSKKVKKSVKAETGVMPSQYARYFDEANPNWSKSPEANKYFLECAQNVLNDQLKTRGHLFLNEVYDQLGFPRTEAGQLVGWVMNGDGDGYVDFNIYQDVLPKREFVNGYERSILLDFNVDGVVADLI